MSPFPRTLIPVGGGYALAAGILGLFGEFELLYLGGAFLLAAIAADYRRR